MKSETLISVLQATHGVRTVKVKFSEHGEGYTYKTTEVHTPGDFVVVECKGAYSVAKVVKMDEVPDVLNDQIQLKWVVQTVNTQRIDEIREEETRIANQMVLAEAKRLVSAALGDLQIDMPVLFNAS